MRNDTRRNKPDRPSGSNPETGTAGSKTPGRTSPQRTDAEREQMQAGLRILARMIARSHLRRETDRASQERPPEPGTGG